MENTQFDKAVVSLAAQDIVSKLNKQIENILKLEVSDVMPLVDSIRTQFGPEKAEEFSTACSELFSGMKEGLLAAKLALGTSVDAISSTTSDMVEYQAPEEDDLSVDQPEEDVATETDQDAAGDVPSDNVGVSDADAIMTPSIGRDPKMIESIMESSDSDSFIIDRIMESVSSGISATQAIRNVASALDIDIQDVMEVAANYLKKKV